MTLKHLGYFSKYEASDSHTACIDLCSLEDPINALQQYRTFCSWGKSVPLNERYKQIESKLGRCSYREPDAYTWAFRVDLAIFFLILRENSLTIRIQGDTSPATVSQVVDELQKTLASA